MMKTGKKQAIRHAEKRRTSTCIFADRVAQLSVSHYQATIPLSERAPQTCIATILAHNSFTGNLFVLSMGVGTKFLSERCLRRETDNGNCYGSHVRDMHAEPLSRRAFRKKLTVEILNDLKKGYQTITPTNDTKNSILVRFSGLDGNSTIRYKLRQGITLHMYSSSAPCGNATLKKFCKMSKEKFQNDLGPDEWPKAMHEPPPGHSIKLGEFALLLKKDNTDHSDDYVCMTIKDSSSSKQRGKPWPSKLSDDWTPPGTTIVEYRDKGSIHTCSDKILRWNYLGLQGSLLAGLLDEPLYLSTLTVGRKLSGNVCRRAICCRLDVRIRRQLNLKSTSVFNHHHNYRINHPAVLGTSVYLNEGVVETGNNDGIRGQDVRFHSSISWVWWLDHNMGKLECIENSGLLMNPSIDHQQQKQEETMTAMKNCTTNRIIASQVSTRELTSSFLEAYYLATGIICAQNDHDKMKRADDKYTNNSFCTISGLRKIKRICSPIHEEFKDFLLTNHKVLSQWQRRNDEN